MKKVITLGQRTVHYFKDSNGTIMKEIVAGREDWDSRFLNLNGGKPNPPIKDGYTWVSAKAGFYYDTIDGELQIEDYALITENGEERVLMRLTDKGYLNLSKKEISDIKALPTGSKTQTYKGELDAIFVDSIKTISDSELL